MTKEEAENYVAPHPGPCPRCGAPHNASCAIARGGYPEPNSDWYVNVAHEWTCGHHVDRYVGVGWPEVSGTSHRIPCHVRTDFIDTCVAVFVAMGRPVDMALIQHAVDERHPAPKKEEPTP